MATENNNGNKKEGQTETPALTDAETLLTTSTAMVVSNAVSTLAKTPSDAAKILKSSVELVVAGDPNLLSIYNDAKNRKLGIYFGGGLASISLIGGMILALAGAGIVPFLACFSLGAACAGGVLASSTGESISTKKFIGMLNAIKNPGHSNGNSEGEND